MMDIIGLENLSPRTRKRLNDYYKKYPTHIRYGYNKDKRDPDKDDELYWDEMDGRLANYEEEKEEK